MLTNPSSHAWQDVLPGVLAKKPGVHFWHWLALPGAKKPASHTWHCVRLLVATEPSSHGTQRTLPGALATLPVAQGTHFEASNPA